MTLTRWNPEVSVAPVSELLPRFSLLRQGIDRLFDSFFSGDTLADTSLGSYWMPAVDILEQDDAYVVKAELPGMKKEDVSITIHDNILTLRGERKDERSENSAQYHRVERIFGSFIRSFTLPSTVKMDKVEAVYKDGVLTITLPKSEEAKPKAIPVRGS
jgi:HSP20 family protein